MIDNEYKRLQQLPSFATMEEVPPVHVDLLHVMRFFSVISVSISVVNFIQVMIATPETETNE